MAQDNTQQDPHTTSTPPDRAAQGDVSTTGHSTYDAQGPAPDSHGDHDAHAAHDAHDAHDAGDAHGGHGHGPDTSDVPTLVPTTWRQLVLPALILLLVLILVSGPIMNAFAYRPAAGPETEQTEPPHEGEGAVPPGTATTVAFVESTATTALAPTSTTAATSEATATAAGPTATLSPGDRL